MRKTFYRRFVARVSSVFADGWNDVRFRWYATDKAPWVFGSIVAAVVGAFGFFMYAHFVNKAEMHELTCLALNVYFEARGEPEAGQYAVAQVTMNRVASPRYPKTVCGVVYQQNWDPLRKRYVAAFSWTEFNIRPAPRDREWRRAQRIAEEVYFGRRLAGLDGAVLYHAVYIRPSWARDMKPVHRIGKHVFYK